MEYILLIVGLVILVVSGNFLVDSATGIAKKFGIPSLIIGLTIVAFGTSAPELFVSVSAGLKGSPAIALGNVVGSNCINVSVIVGLTALICPFAVKRESITIDTMFMLFLTIVLFGFGVWDDGISRMEGALMFLMLVAYTVFSIRRAKNVHTVAAEIEAEQGQEEKKVYPVWVNALILIVSIAALGYGADMMVDSAKVIARNFGMSERVISVTIVALGTSLPELTASVVGALKGEEDLAVGGIVGSNIFNIGSVLALSSCCTPITFNPMSDITTPQFMNDIIWVFIFEVMLLIGMINVTDNYSEYKRSKQLTRLFSADNGLVGRIWGASAVALYAYYVYLLLSKTA